MAGSAQAPPPAASRRRVLMLVAVAALLVLGLIVAVAVMRPEQPVAAAGRSADMPALLPTEGPQVDRPLPAVTLPALQGFGPRGGRDLSDLRGEPLIINFWASWCAPCIEEMPTLQKVATDTGIAVIGIDYLDRPEPAIELARKLGITYELLRDDDGSFGERLGLLGTPTTLLVDRRGTIVRQLTGELSEAQLREAIGADLP